MLDRLRASGIQDEAVLNAMAEVPRHRFVDAALASRAYEDTALPIGYAQTISQPYVVARSLSLARQALGPEDASSARALEIGTGCGYQAAVMSLLFAQVVSVERIEPLHRGASDRLRGLGYRAELQLADGQAGLPEAPDFDLIVMAAGMPHPPTELLRQLREGGVFVGPIGAPEQRLVVIRRGSGQQFQTHTHDVVQFVPIRSGIQP
jgi:protein-L-isoaspartate(D-aspartate) O-methyltransferase